MRLCFGCDCLKTMVYGMRGYGLICCPENGDIHPRGEWISTEFGFKVPHAESKDCWRERKQAKL